MPAAPGGRGPQGSALVFALGFVSVLLIVALGSHTLVARQLRAAGMHRQHLAARYLAEGGLQRAAAWFRTQGYQLPAAAQLTGTVPVRLAANDRPVVLPDNHPDRYTDAAGTVRTGVVTGFRSLLAGQTLGDGTYTVTASLIARSPETWELIATGTVGRVSRQAGAVLVREPQPLFAQALFGREAVQMSGNARIDSYDSARGPYGPSNRGSEGHVRSNGPIALSGNVRVEGNAMPGPNQLVTLSGNAAVTGATTPATGPLVPAPVTVPAGITSLGALNLSGNQTRTLTAGTWLVSGISVTGNARLVIDASGGPVTLYVTGSISVAGNGIFNGSGRPSNLMIFQSGTAGISFSGNADFYGTIYAPESPVAISGNGELYGAVIAASVQNSGNGGIHYDQALRAIPGGPTLVRLLGVWMQPS